VNDLHGASPRLVVGFSAASVRATRGHTASVRRPRCQNTAMGRSIPAGSGRPKCRRQGLEYAEGVQGSYMRQSMGARLFGAVIVLLMWGATVWADQVGTALGPRDGTGPPPTDLERVAVGSLAPDFSLESKDGAAVTLSDFRGRKNVVLVFYRGHW
jgi:hypothetical protein